MPDLFKQRVTALSIALAIFLLILHLLRRRRLREARRLLLTTTLPVKEVARRCGYEDPLYFSRVFHQHTGQPPLACRESAKNP